MACISLVRPHGSEPGYQHNPGQGCMEDMQLPMLQAFPLQDISIIQGKEKVLYNLVLLSLLEFCE